MSYLIARPSTRKRPNWRAAVANIEVKTKANAVVLAQMVGIEVTNYLRSLTAKTRPPARAGEGNRFAHPGGWADVRGTLANAYEWSVTPTATGARLRLSNSMSYAIFLELKDGYYVLSGVGEEGGPVDAAIRKIAGKLGLAPWPKRLR